MKTVLINFWCIYHDIMCLKKTPQPNQTHLTAILYYMRENGFGSRKLSVGNNLNSSEMRIKQPF